MSLRYPRDIVSWQAPFLPRFCLYGVVLSTALACACSKRESAREEREIAPKKLVQDTGVVPPPRSPTRAPPKVRVMQLTSSGPTSLADIGFEVSVDLPKGSRLEWMMMAPDGLGEPVQSVRASKNLEDPSSADFMRFFIRVPTANEATTVAEEIAGLKTLMEAADEMGQEFEQMQAEMAQYGIELDDVTEGMPDGVGDTLVIDHQEQRSNGWELRWHIEGENSHVVKVWRTDLGLFCEASHQSEAKIGEVLNRCRTMTPPF